MNATTATVARTTVLNKSGSTRHYAADGAATVCGDTVTAPAAKARASATYCKKCVAALDATRLDLQAALDAADFAPAAEAAAVIRIPNPDAMGAQRRAIAQGIAAAHDVDTTWVSISSPTGTSIYHFDLTLVGDAATVAKLLELIPAMLADAEQAAKDAAEARKGDMAAAGITGNAKTREVKGAFRQALKDYAPAAVATLRGSHSLAA